MTLVVKPRASFDINLLRSQPHVIDIVQMREHAARYAHTDFVQALDKAIDSGKAAYVTDFFIEVCMQDARHLRSTQDHFIVRRSCPLPEFNRIVYRWHYNDNKIEYLWMLPSKYKALALYSNLLTPDEANNRAREFVMQYMDQSLHKKSDEINLELEKRII